MAKIAEAAITSRNRILRSSRSGFAITKPPVPNIRRPQVAVKPRRVVAIRTMMPPARLTGGAGSCIPAIVRTSYLFVLFALNACSAQQWQLGAGVGYGIYNNGTIFAPAGTATAGVRNRFAVSVWASQDVTEYIGGEVRYTYQDGDPFLSVPGTKTNLQGQSHAFDYNVLFRLRPKEAALRPYVATGIGAKLYVITGPPNPAQPLRNIAVLTTNNQAVVLVTLGGGLNYEVSHRVALRLEFLDYITPFPKRYIQPAPLATARGILHQFTPLLGVSYVF